MFDNVKGFIPVSASYVSQLCDNWIKNDQQENLKEEKELLGYIKDAILRKRRFRNKIFFWRDEPSLEVSSEEISKWIEKHRSDNFGCNLATAYLCAKQGKMNRNYKTRKEVQELKEAISLSNPEDIVYLEIKVAKVLKCNDHK